MILNANSISKIEATKTAFEKAFKENLVNDCFRNIVTASIPLKEGEREKINDPEFKDKFTAVLSDVSREIVNKFDHVAQFDTGNLMTSMVNSVSDSVSLEANYRQQKLVNDIRLGRINQDEVSLNIACESVFMDTKKFTNKDIEKRFIQEMNYNMSIEDANDIVERIKNDVKDAIEETEAKNDLVEGTTQEIIDYKNEIAPPDDQYKDPEDPANDQSEAITDEQQDPSELTSDAGDDLNSDDLDSEDDQIYETDPVDTTMDSGDTDVGSEPTLNGENINLDQTNPGNNPTQDTTTDQLADTGNDNVQDTNADTSDSSGLDAGADTGDLGGTTDSTMTGGDDGALSDNSVPDDSGVSNTEINNSDIGGDLGGADTMNGDPSAPAAANNNGAGGVVININGANLQTPSTQAAVESLNLFTPRTLAEKRIPLNLRKFMGMALPDVNTLSSECVNACGDVREEFANRLDGLRIMNKQAWNAKSKESATEKIDAYGKIIGDAISNAGTYNKILNTIGITPQGLIRSNENTFAIARNIINRFILKKQFVSPTIRPYTSKENVFANAFDIVQLRQYINRQKEPKTEMIDDLESRENVFYHNMVNWNDADVKKEATAIIDLSRLNFQKAMSPNFITDYKIKVWEENVGDKSNIEINNEVVKRVADKFSKLWGRELNDDEMAIIKATTNQEDVTGIVPTPYEKFLITMSKEAILAHGSEDILKGASLSSKEKKDIEWKARLMTSVYKAAEAFNILGYNDKENFIKFNTMIRM